MKILLIGHRGYLGQGLLEYLSKENDVIGWDKEEDLFQLSSEILSKNNIEAIINLSVVADLASPKFQVDTPGDTINVEGAKHLARVLKGSEIFWFQFSTREVFNNIYGENDVVFTDIGYRPKFFIGENQPYSPQNFYGKSKVIAEFISESHPFSNVIRLTSPYTNHNHAAGGWVLRLIKSIAKGNPLKLNSGGYQFRDPLHTDDLGSLIELLYERRVAGEKIHAGGGENNLISLREFVQLVDDKVNFEAAPGNDYGFAFDNSKASALTGWSPIVSIRERIPVILRNVLQS
jgi:nucleoside-diphosphate-sugar epimerase